MEFVKPSEVVDLLRDQGLEESADGDERVYLTMRDQEGVVHVHLTNGRSAAEPRAGATVIEMDADAFPNLVEQVIHRLALSEVLLIPVGKWRKVFDVVAFSLASNEDWQEVDAAATVELNTRDPLLAGPADFHVVIDLIRTLLSDAESPEEGLLLTTTGVPILVAIIPDGALRMSFGNRVLADEVMDVVAA